MKYLKILAKEIEPLKPEAKLLLVRIVYSLEMEAYENATWTVRELRSIFDVNYKSIKELVDFLIENHFLKSDYQKLKLKDSFTDFFFEKVDDPSLYFFKIEPKVGRKKYLVLNTKLISHNFIIERIILNESKKGYENVSINLTRSESLLLSVLYLYAEENGVVSELGYQKICKLTGMTRDRVRGQIKKLNKVGFIRKYYSGKH